MSDHDGGSEPMNEDNGGYRPLSPERRAAVTRRDTAQQRVRRVSAWTAAGLIAATAAGAGYFAHAGTTAHGAIGQATTGSAHGTSQRPSLNHPVVTSGGSGVTAGGPAGSPAGGATASWRDN